MAINTDIFGSILPWLEKGSWMLQVIIAFGILIAIHEFGHYISAKLTGMKVEEFSIGFGKRMLGFKRGETEYSWRIVPLGGYCKIFGMEDDYDPDNPENAEREISPDDLDRAFNNKPIWKFTNLIAEISTRCRILPLY